MINRRNAIQSVAASMAAIPFLTKPEEKKSKAISKEMAIVKAIVDFKGEGKLFKLYEYEQVLNGWIIQVNAPFNWTSHGPINSITFEKTSDINHLMGELREHYPLSTIAVKSFVPNHLMLNELKFETKHMQYWLGEKDGKVIFENCMGISGRIENYDKAKRYEVVFDGRKTTLIPIS